MNRPKTKQPYKTVRGLLADKKRWCKGKRRLVTPDGQESYCLIGAIEEVYGFNSSISHEIRDNLYGIIRGSVVGFNDDPKTRHSDILKVLKKAKI